MASRKGSRPHVNEERTVRCPYCGDEVLARGLYLHVLRSSGNGHGESNDVPDSFDPDKAETVGTKRVQMNYPEHRTTEKVARMCPYCERPFTGRHGVLIHLGQMKGKAGHPADPAEDFDPADFPVVPLDEFGNIDEVVGGDVQLPATQRRLDEAELEERVRAYIADLRKRGDDEAADEAEALLYGN